MAGPDKEPDKRREDCFPHHAVYLRTCYIPHYSSCLFWAPLSHGSGLLRHLGTWRSKRPAWRKEKPPSEFCSCVRESSSIFWRAALVIARISWSYGLLDWSKENSTVFCCSFKKFHKTDWQWFLGEREWLFSVIFPSVHMPDVRSFICWCISFVMTNIKRLLDVSSHHIISFESRLFVYLCIQHLNILNIFFLMLKC